MKISKITVFALLAVLIISAPSAVTRGDAAQKNPLPPAFCFKIVVSEQGMVRIDCGELARMADISALDPRKLNLYNGGKAIPILIDGEEDGKLDPTDSIVFYCGRGNPRSPSDVFWLKPAMEGEAPLRYREDDRKQDPEAKAIDVVEKALPLRDRMGAGDRAGPGGLTVSTRTVNTWEPVRLDVVVNSGGFVCDEKTRAKLVLRLRRRPCGADYGVDWCAELSSNGKKVEFKETVNDLDWYLTAEIPQTAFKKDGDKYTLALTLVNKSKYPADAMEGFVAAMVYVQDASLTVIEKPTARNGQVIVRNSSVKADAILKMTLFTSPRIAVFYPREGLKCVTVFKQEEIGVVMGSVMLHPAGPCIIVGKDSYLKPLVEPYEIESRHKEFPRHPDLRAHANEADYLIIAPSALTEAAQALAKYRALPRRDGAKFATMVVDAQEIYDQFDSGRFGPKPIKDFLEYARKNWIRPPRYVVLAADAVRDSDYASPGLTIPAYQCETWFSGICGTDNWYGTWKDDGIPEISIGRLPARNPAELKVMTDKIIAYETSSENGVWRRKLDMVAAEAGMGPKIDALLETMSRAVFGSMMPRVFDIEVTYSGEGSDYCYPAKEFNAHFIESVNKGALMLTYVGHGNVREFERLSRGANEFVIFGAADVAKLNCAGHSPIMLILACDTGAFDRADEECIGEDIIRAANAPIAVVAASTESHPYGNGILGMEMLPAFFGRGGVFAPARAPLGDMLRDLKTRNINGKGVLRFALDVGAKQWVKTKEVAQRLRVDHQYMYNLLGDPALQVALPQFDMKLAADRETAKPGDKVKVSGSCDGIKNGNLLVTFECDVTDLLYPPSEPAKDDKAIMENYRRNNDKVVISRQVQVTDGKFSLEIEIPKVVEKTKQPLKPGTYYIKAYLTGEKADAFAAVEITIPSE